MKTLTSTIERIPAPDAAARAKAHARLEQLTMPHWALGRLMDLAEDLAGMTANARPPVQRKTIVTMAGDHGVTAEGVSKYPAEVTPQMVHNFVHGGAGINALSRLVGARVVVVDMGVAGDLSALAKAGKIVSKRIAPGTKKIGRAHV
jgi:nicotinate-nucleotide--dimethylbenzimidazole phosphoribosyltransferase